MQTAPTEAARRNMVDSQLRTNGITAPWIVAATLALPRERFLPADKAASAYLDRSVPLGNGRWLNPPLATVQLLQAAEVRPEDSILVVGAGTGYLAGLLGGQAKQIVAVESDPALAAAAKANVPGLGLVEGPLDEGVAASAPFSLIIIDGAIEQLPEAIAAQLAEGGRLVTGLAEGAVSRLAMGVKHGGKVVLRTFADLEVAPLPRFAKAKEFVF
jgi:protein-L-isoaspartate(D-aspartate) O-methyltransferase